MSMRILGVDTGGTFTDVVCFFGGELQTLKLPSSRHDPSQAILEAVGEITQGHACQCTHGTTVGTNALLERRGGPIALITTAGFRDLLTLGRGQRRQLYALHPIRPPGLVQDHHCFEVDERIDAQGEVVIPLERAQCDHLAARIKAENIHSVAVCLIYSYLNPSHEEMLAQALEAQGLRAFLSHRLCPEEREFERCSTTAVSAYLFPTLESYLRRLENKLSELNCRSLQIVHSGGARISVDEALEIPSQCTLSGPAAGVRGAAQVARAAGVRRFLCLDMGGTSTDVALYDGHLPYVQESEVDGLPLRQLILDIQTVGAGGGSIVRVDGAGALTVGPDSVGSDPGPAAYGKGTLPCVSDANLVLGRLPQQLAGGRVEVRRELSEQALLPLAQRLGVTVEQVALAALEVVQATMERALRRVSLERGHDPRDFTLLAYGGAGPLHAAELAQLLGCREVLIPTHPGLLCAWGAALAPWQREFSRSLQRPLAALEHDELEAIFRDLARQAPDKARLERYLELRYRGQGHGFTVAAQRGLEAAVVAFTRRHQKVNGYLRERGDIEVCTARLRATRERSLGAISPTAPPPSEQLDENQETQQGLWIYRRTGLVLGQRLRTPCRIEQADCTSFVPEGWDARVDSLGNIRLQRVSPSDAFGKELEAT